MHSEHDTALRAAIVVTLGVVAVFLALFFLPASNGGAPLLPAAAFVVDPIEARYAYQDDLHTYEGSIELPESCMRLMSKGVVEDAAANTIALSFETVREEGVECSVERREQTFYIVVDAPANITTQATFNGRAVSVELSETPPEESAS